MTERMAGEVLREDLARFGYGLQIGFAPARAHRVRLERELVPSSWTNRSVRLITSTFSWVLTELSSCRSVSSPEKDSPGLASVQKPRIVSFPCAIQYGNLNQQ